jgi:hypothetical protein
MMRNSSRTYFGIMLTCSMLTVACLSCKQDTQSKTKETDFEIDKLYERGPLTVHERLDKSTLTIAETLMLQLEASISPDYEVEMPRIDQVLQNFGIVDWDNLGTKLAQDNKVVTTHQYRLESFLSGNYEIPPFTFQFHDVNDPNQQHQLSTEPISIEVTSLLGAERAELTIADIEGVVEMPTEASYWWLWLLIPVAATGTIAILLFLRTKRAKKLIRIFKPAHELAYARLQAMVKDDLIAKGKIKEFYERVSDILRHYIEDRFMLRAPERTTEEFLAELQTTDILAPTEKQTLEEFLTHCDLVKFAKYDPTKEQIQRTFDLVKIFIEKTRSDQSKIDITDRVKTEETVEAGAA